MRLKRGFLTLIAVVVVLGVVVSPAISINAEVLGSHDHCLISPMYNYTNSIGVNLFFEGNTAQCSGFVFPSGSYNVSATLTLYKQIVSGSYKSSTSNPANPVCGGIAHFRHQCITGNSPYTYHEHYVTIV